VKIAVDAYDGTMKFYVIDDEDPLIQAWRNAFPDLFTSEEVPAELAAHFRYPEDLFKIQSEVFLTYHIEDPNDYYSKEDVWAIPAEAAGTDEFGQTVNAEAFPPTYLVTQLPQEPEAEFLLARPFTPRTKNNMIAFMVARSDPEHYGEIVILQFPRSKLVVGPLQVHNLINQDVEVSQTLTLLGQEGSEVTFGSLITLPIDDSILYVQPLFVTGESIGIPELKRVLLVYGEQVVMGESFEDALGQLFGAAPEVEEPPKGGGPKPPDTSGPQVGQDVQQVLDEASRLYDQAQAALADGDFEEYGRLIKELGQLLEQAKR
jgi:uncharacterized membrane protein (UPF0182 family)